MELIPILATIILMATISTFFLAVGAYVLYKIRERRGVINQQAAPETIQAELITPELMAEQVRQTVEQTQKSRAPIKPFERPNPPSYKPSAEPIVQRQAPAPPAAVRAPESAPQPMTQVGPAPAQQKNMQVANEGLQSTKEEKKQAARWR